MFAHAWSLLRSPSNPSMRLAGGHKCPFLFSGHRVSRNLHREGDAQACCWVGPQGISEPFHRPGQGPVHTAGAEVMRQRQLPSQQTAGPWPPGERGQSSDCHSKGPRRQAGWRMRLRRKLQVAATGSVQGAWGPWSPSHYGACARL